MYQYWIKGGIPKKGDVKIKWNIRPLFELCKHYANDFSSIKELVKILDFDKRGQGMKKVGIPRSETRPICEP